ncbi:MAG: MmgE/PrpD family protein [Hyphomicrobium sp.]|uniref:MmgE/PrpD family protein n=1 Tax=Hyphomicrobium sp. CS1BSMeth3 TaxID=1892844 RepID=UPI000930CE12|nr:MmgE/PrpD family protein [Hyphomicrobium sp. CS1BSMeth3]MBN9280453.1 MmgE/PrpD family protein [Hyphomicrobium sp.]
MPSVSTPQQAEELKGLTMRFAEHVAGLKYENIPDDVAHKAKLILRDGVGNEIAASAISEPANKVIELVKEWGGAPQSTIIGHGMKVPTPNAALVNAMMGHGIELDDAHGTGLIKAGSVLVPAAFAVAEISGASGKDVVAGVVAGYDVAVRIAKAINPGHRQRGYHTTGTVSAIGAAAMSAKLLGGNAEQIAWAIGLACMQSAGIQSYLDDPCMAKPFSPGKSAYNGVLAAIMASRGFSGPKKVLESREGFLNAFTDSVRLDDLQDNLGKHFAIMEVGFKPHAACRYAHGPIDLAQDAYRLDGVRLDNVDRVTVHMSKLAIRQASKPVCTNLNAAMGSTQFSVALSLASGGNGLKEYWDGYKQSDVHSGMNKVELREEPAYGLGGRQAQIDIALKDGRKVTRSSEEPKGEPSNPLAPAELEAKFLAMTTMVIDEKQARKVSDLVMSLERQPKADVIPQATVVDNGPSLRAA